MDDPYEVMREAIKSYRCPSCGTVGKWYNTCPLAVDDTGIYAECGGRIRGQECYYILTATDMDDLIKSDASFRNYVKSQDVQMAPWDTTYYEYPCPYCGQYKVRNAKWGDKAISTAFWGFFSHKLHCNYKCDSCGKMWD